VGQFELTHYPGFAPLHLFARRRLAQEMIQRTSQVEQQCQLVTGSWPPFAFNRFRMDLTKFVLGE
jgi:hypothetical protein